MAIQPEIVYLTATGAERLPPDFPFRVSDSGNRYIVAKSLSFLESGWLVLSAIPEDVSDKDRDSWVSVTLPPASVAAIVRH